MSRLPSNSRASDPGPPFAPPTQGISTLPAWLQKAIFGTPRYPGHSSRPIPHKNADYDDQMLSEIDNQWTFVPMKKFMNNFLPASGDPPADNLKRACNVLARGFNVKYDGAKEHIFYPILVSFSRHSFRNTGSFTEHLIAVQGFQHPSRGL